MTTNKYFNQFPATNSKEQALVENLVNEAIQMYGVDVYYLPRTSLSEQDKIYGEDPVSTFTSALKVEMYLDNVKEYTGQGEFFGKFGLEIRQGVEFMLSRRAFKRVISGFGDRPREGDLIYIPALSNMFEIKFVNETPDFYTLGRRPPEYYYYQLRTELFKFSNERFRTGNAEIDQFGRDYAYTIRLEMATGAGNYATGEIVWNDGANVATANATAYVKSWNSLTKTLDIMNIKGTFLTGNVTGNTTGAIYSFGTYNRQLFDQVVEQVADNADIQEEANTIIDFSSANPFGDP
jgi:hypothetical protein